MARAAAVLRASEVVAFPSETVYGLGAIATDTDAVSHIFAAKGRPANDPVIVHVTSLAMVREVTGLRQLPKILERLAAAFWPGPLTVVLPRGPCIPLAVTAGRSTVGVRWPSHPVAQALIEAAGAAIAAPSANRFGHVSPTTARHVYDDLAGRIPLILDGGPCAVGIESTILDITQEPPVLLRPGGVSQAAIEAALGTSVHWRAHQSAATTESQLAPGMLLAHYAPRAPLVVYEGADRDATWARVRAEIQSLAARGMRVGALAPGVYGPDLRAAGAMATADLGADDADTEAAQYLYAGLRALDDVQVEIIVAGVVIDEQSALDAALRDRLWRAAAGHVEAVIPSS